MREIEMNARLTVNCSHSAFKSAMKEHLKGKMFHEIPWRLTEMHDEFDEWSSFSYPEKNYPELTYDIFWKMAVSCLAAASSFPASIYIEMVSPDKAFRVFLNWEKFCEGTGWPVLYYDAALISKDMSDRLKEIARIAGGNE